MRADHEGARDGRVVQRRRDVPPEFTPEGEFGLRGRRLWSDGVLYILGLARELLRRDARKGGGETAGGDVAKELDDKAGGGCIWKTKRVLNCLHRQLCRLLCARYPPLTVVATTSRELSAMGRAASGIDVAFDPEAAEFSEGEVFDFARARHEVSIATSRIIGSR